VCAADIGPEQDQDTGSADGDFEIWHDNLDSLNAYTACKTQWRWMMYGTKAFRLGLDYPGVKTVLWGLKVKNPQQVFNDIRVMEAAALAIFNAAG